jgi:hypothetical protein
MSTLRCSWLTHKSPKVFEATKGPRYRRTELALDALNMALYRRRPSNVSHHSDQAANTLRSHSESVALRPEFAIDGFGWRLL